MPDGRHAAPACGGPAVTPARRLLGGLVTVAAATMVITAAEGTAVIGPVAVPVWGTCSVPECWRLVVRDSDGTTSEPCVSREEYDSTSVGTFWRGRTDR